MGRHVFVGGTSGIGQAAALSLARKGESLLVVGRDEHRGRRTERLLKEAGASEAKWLPADLRSVKGVRAASQAILGWRPTLDSLVHSAMTNRVQIFGAAERTDDGYELAFGLQYLARVALNRALLPRLQASGLGRIVHVGAKPPKGFRPDLSDLQFERRSKTFILTRLMSSQVLGFLHAQEAARRWTVPVSIACVGPTMTDTIKVQPAWVRVVYSPSATTPEKSAENVIQFISDTKARPGQATLSSRRFDPTTIAYEPQLASDVWTMTEKLLEG